MAFTIDNNTAKTELTIAQVTPDRRFPPLHTVDNGQVRLGGQGPIFRSSLADTGKVRIGGQGPIFR